LALLLSCVILKMSLFWMFLYLLPNNELGYFTLGFTYPRISLMSHESL
jgi:hypothetical protein